MPLVKKDIRYLNRDFGQFRQGLIDFTRNYFPKSYADFNESSPGMIFIEHAAYLGDVLSFYIDTQLRESLLNEAQETSNIYNIAQSYGYKPKLRSNATVELDVFQLIPSTVTTLGVPGSESRPDFIYALNIESGMRVSSETGITFTTINAIDFQYSSSIDPTEISVYNINASGEIEYYLAKKRVKAISGQIRSATYAFDTPKPYDKIVIPDDNVTEIVSIIDSEGNTWYEVDYLGQDLVRQDIRNIPFYDPDMAEFRGSVPYILKLRKTPRRFVTRMRADGKLTIQFGSGISSAVDEEIVPNPKNVGLGLTYLSRLGDSNIDPSNFLYTRAYGLAPANTTLTVTYRIGSGVSENVPANTIVNLVSKTVNNPNNEFSQVTLNAAIDSLAVNNPEPATGAFLREDVETIRQNALGFFAAQNRAVTQEDYITRVYAMPSKYGVINKCFIEQDEQLESRYVNDRFPNPFALNLYCLSIDSTGNFTGLNTALRENLRNYLKQYRLLTDAVNIKDAYIINIGIDFEIITLPNYNANEVLLRCINYLKRVFHNDRQQIKAPIIMSSIRSGLDQVEGVQTVSRLTFKNLFDTAQGYSGNIYDLAVATRDNVIYPSVDPSIFEIKYPNSDIRGRVRAS